MTRPPVRWAHSDLPEELSRLIASSAPLPHDAAALARMRERLHDSLGPSFETRVSGADATSHVLSMLQRAKWLCAAALATAGLSFVSVQSLQSKTGAGPTRTQPLAAELSVQPASEAGFRHSLAAEAAPSQRSAEAQPVSDAPRARVEREGRAGNNGAEHGQGPARDEHFAKASAGHERRRGSARPEHVAKPSGGSTHEQGREHIAPKADKPAAVSGEPAPSGLAAELRGLAEIRKLLHSSPTRALALAETQERQFAQGALGPERELLRIDALIRAGRADEAKRRAARALSASNNPPYRARIEKLFAHTASLRLAADGVAKGVTRE